MSDIEVHRKDCLWLFGQDYVHVHRWLDQYAKDFIVSVWNDYHRSFLHNSYGLEIIEAKWGDMAYEAGLIHLARDFDDVAPTGRLPKISLKALMWFNNLENMEAHVHPSTVKAWNGKSLVSLLYEK